MTLRIVQMNCVIDHEARRPEALLAAWPTLPAVAAATARAGAVVTVVQASRFAAEHRRDGVTYRFVAEPRWRPGSGAGMRPARIARAVAGAMPDIVHFNGLDFPAHARAVCRLGVPVLVQDHASRVDGTSGLLRGWGYRRSAAVAFTAAAQAEPFVALRQLSATMPVFAIPECSSDFTPGDQDAARHASGVFGDPALLWVGHLDANKDPLTILHAVRRALPALPGLHLWCAFVGSRLLPDVERLLRDDAVLAAHVHLLGRLPHAQIETLCQACDLFVAGSAREGSGYALIEALACGTTPIVTDIPSFRALTGGGAIGAIVPRGDVDAFAAAIVTQSARPRAAQRQAVLAHFRRHLSFDILGTRLVEAYETILGRTGSA